MIMMVDLSFLLRALRGEREVLVAAEILAVVYTKERLAQRAVTSTGVS
jgi:hypothetical protein